jgi:hypothetical protein
MADTEFSLPVTAADPTVNANAVKLYAKSVAGVVQFFARADDGTVYQLTPTGLLPVTILHSTPFTAQPGFTNAVDGSVGALTVNLPAASSSKGQFLAIKIETTGTGPINVTPAGADTIDGSPSFAMSTAHESIIMVSNGSDTWLIIGTYP